MFDVCLTADEGPQVKSHGALQCFIGSTEGVEEEEAGGHGGEEDDNTTKEDDRDVEASWDSVQQVWEDWERNDRGYCTTTTIKQRHFTGCKIIIVKHLH